MKDQSGIRLNFRCLVPILCVLFLIVLTSWAYTQSKVVDEGGQERAQVVIDMIDDLADDPDLVMLQEVTPIKDAFNKLDHCEQLLVTNAKHLADTEREVVDRLPEEDRRGYSYIALPDRAEWLIVYEAGLILFLTVGCIWSVRQKANIEAYLSAIVMLMGIGGVYQILFEGFIKFMVLSFGSLVAFAAAYMIGRKFTTVSSTVFKVILGLIAALLVFNYFFGISATEHGSRLWVSLGPFVVQPSEIVKVLLIVLGAASYQSQRRMLAYSSAALISCVFFIYMGDFGNAAVIFSTFFIMTMVLMDKPLLTAAVLATVLIGVFVLVGESSYASERIANWGSAMEIADSQQGGFIIGELLGGFKGLGIQHSHYFSYRESAMNDGALAGVMAVYGVPMTFLALALYSILIVQSMLNVPVSPFAHYIHHQIAALMFAQVFLSYAGALDVIPFTGLVSPFISSGGTSLLTLGCLLGFGAASLNPHIWPKASRAKRMASKSKGGYAVI